MQRVRETTADKSGMTGVELALVGVVFLVGLIGVGSVVGWSFPILLAKVAPTATVTIAP